MRVKVYGGRFKVINNRARYYYEPKAKDVINVINADVVLNAEQRLAASYLMGWIIIESLISKLKALYGLLGGNASTHKWNWSDLRNIDDAFRIVWSGSVVHSTFGIQSFSSGFGDTKLIPSTILSSGISISAYINQNPSPTSTEYTIGATLPNLFNNSLITSRTGGGSIFVASGYNTVNQRADINGDLGMYVGSYLTKSDIFFRGAKGSTSNFNNAPNKANIPLYILGGNGADFTQKRIAFASIGDGITDSESIALSNIVMFYQIILNRK